ncbi:unnamed protein product [Moneuplotes crassus]|uniref:Uncharacterized protein n=1 Tax=Euplotes crassus TaxID=5936 RepID=A0AAD2D5V9_EUPCR|nr:unnamed protein product [Moneuplotes crassus]
MSETRGPIIYLIKKGGSDGISPKFADKTNPGNALLNLLFRIG